MDNKVAVIGIIIENYSKADDVNKILHGYGEYIIGRMGVPYKEKNINIISIVINAPVQTINALTGKLGMMQDVSAKALFSNK